MAADSDARRRMTQQPINPRTGVVWRLTDVEVSSSVDAFQASLSSKTKALEYLKSSGFLTSNGKLPAKYGG